MGAKVATFEQCYNAEKRRRLQYRIKIDKNPSIVLLSYIFCVPLPPITSHWNRLVALSREFLRPFGSKRQRRWLWYANHGRMRKWEPLPVRNPDFSQSSKLPLFTKGLRFYPKLQNNFSDSKFNINYLPAFLQRKCFSALPWAQRHQDFLKFDHFVIGFFALNYHFRCLSLQKCK